MDADTARAKQTLSKLGDSLDELEDALEQLLSKPLEETSAQLSNVLDQAKLNVLVPYMVHDLIFIYLKTRGVDPKKHPVVAELERIKQYFAKIKHAEDPEKRRLAIDKDAAGRFIKAAIASAQLQQQPESSTKQHKDDTSSSEDEDEGKAVAAKPAQEPPAGKRRRPVYDPFAGYGETATDSPSTSKSSNKRQKLDSSASSAAFKYNESASSNKKGKAKVDPEPEPDTRPESDDGDDESVLDVIDGGDMVIEDPEPNVDGSWTVVEKAKQKAKEKKEKLGFGKSKKRRESGGVAGGGSGAQKKRKKDL